MVFKPRRLAIVMTMLCVGLGSDTWTKAGIVINAPPGLVPGDTFRIAFVTDGITSAESTDINFYNTFVNNDAIAQAGGGSVTYDGTTLIFSAIGSTATTSAIANIGATGAPVYLSNGTLIASSDTTAPGGLWNDRGSAYNVLLAPLNRDLLGVVSSYTIVCTGTNPDGTSAVYQALGFTPPQSGYSNTIIGEIGQISSGWISNGSDDFISLPMYGISQVLTVVPEPSSIVMALVGLGAAITYSTARRQKTPRAAPNVGRVGGNARLHGMLVSPLWWHRGDTTFENLE